MGGAGPSKSGADPRPGPLSGWGDPEHFHVERRPGVWRAAFRLGLYTTAVAVLLGLGMAAGRLSWTTPAPLPGVIPGEFEVQEALLLGVPDVCLEGTVACLGQIVAATHDRVQIVLLTGSPQSRREAEAELRRRGVPLDSVSFLPVDIDYPWTRDYGPLVLKSFDGGMTFIDGLYSGPCDDVPTMLAERLGVPCDTVPLIVGGGNLLSNGSGMLVTTTDFIDRNQWKFGHSPERIKELARGRLGAAQLVVLEPLAGELTQHVDMFATFTAPDVIVVGQTAPEVDSANAEVLDRNAAKLRGLPTRSGPLQVVRIPMPPPRDREFRTYTNVAYVNGVLLAPRHADVDERLNEQALAVFRRLLPAWTIVPIDSDALLKLGGGPHCATLPLYGVDVGALSPPDQ